MPQLKPSFGELPDNGHISRVGLALDLAMIGRGDLYDYSGNTNNGTDGTGGTSSWEADSNGHVLDFASGTVGITLKNTISFTGNNPWTIIWRCKQTGAQNEGMIFGDTDVGNNYMWFRKLVALNIVTAGQTIAFTDATLIANMTDWHTYALVAEGGDVKLYVDGLWRETQSESGQGTAFVFANIAAGFNTLSLSFAGQWAYNSIYPHALSSQEIRQVSENPFPDEVWRPSQLPIWAAAQGVTGSVNLLDGLFERKRLIA